jgi:hypothetical protein
MSMDLFQHISPFFAAAGLFMSSFLGNHHAVLAAHETRPNVNFQKDSFYTASRAVSYQGYNVSMYAAVPKNGGEVTGKISGDCNGKISGHYDGQDNGVINGTVNGSCQLMFIQIPGHASFTGTVSKTNNNAQLNVTVNVASLKKTEPVTVSFN